MPCCSLANASISVPVAAPRSPRANLLTFCRHIKRWAAAGREQVEQEVRDLGCSSIRNWCATIFWVSAMSWTKSQELLQAEPLQLQLHQLHSDCLSVCLSLSLSVWLSVCIGNVVNVLTISAMCVEALQVASASMAAQQQHGSSRILGALQSKSTQWLTDSGTNLQIRRRFTLHALRLTFCACHSNAADNSQGPSHPPPHTSLPPLSQPALQLTGAQGMPGSFWLLPYVVSRNVTRKSNTQKSATTTATATTATATTTAATATTTATTRAVDWVVPMITVS